jgi:hypothetical protein
MTDTELVRVYKITPSGRSDCDDLIVKARNSWADALSFAEQALEKQWYDMEEGAIEWSDITVTIKCGLMTKEELEELMDDA